MPLSFGSRRSHPGSPRGELSESTSDREHRLGRRSRVGRRRNPGVRRKARRWRGVDHALSRPPNGGSRPSEPREPAAERVPALLERDREHRWRPVGDAAGEPARDIIRRQRRSRRSGRRTPSTSAASSRSPPIPATRSSRSRRSRSSSTTRRTTTGTPPTSRASRYVREARPGRSWARTRSRSASASSTCTGSTATRPRAGRRSGTATRATRVSRSAGSTSTTRRPTDSRSSSRTAERQRLLPRLHHEPDRRVPRAGQDEQHRVGQVHALVGVERQPQGHRHGPLAVRGPGCAASGRRTADELARDRVRDDAAGSTLAPLDFRRGYRSDVARPFGISARLSRRQVDLRRSFLHGNPKCPESELEPERCDLDRAHSRTR